MLIAEDLIKKFEGFSNKPYFCPAGIKTIGYGHVIKKGEILDIITEEDASALLQQDIKKFLNQIDKIINVSLNEYQLASIISFTYNVGIAALQRSTLRQKINRNEHEVIPDELMRWVYAGGRKLKGLIERRKIEGLVYSQIFIL